MKVHTLQTILLTAVLIGAPAWALADSPAVAASPYPLVMVDQAGKYRAVYDIHSAETTAGISRGLYYARGLYEAFRNQGVAPGQLNVHLVLHGDATFMLLKDETYQQATHDPFAFNPNAKIVQDLIDLGVSVEACNSAMKSKGWKAADMLPGVAIVHDGYTRLIKLQNDGLAYIGGF